MGRRHRTSGFTLLEMLLVVAILAAAAGIVVVAASGARQTAEREAVGVELVRIREACRRFVVDMGEPPQFLAELMQSPDGTDGLGGWWWRGTSDMPRDTLRSFDPATGRGWNGPYVLPEETGEDGAETSEARLVSASTYDKQESSDAAGRRLAMLRSDFGTYGQKESGGRFLSHYQLDASNSGELAVRFIEDPSVAADETVVVARLGLGVAP